MSEVQKKLLYTETHEWVLLDENIATIGISEHAQKSLGELVYVELPEVGKYSEAGLDICVVESVKAASDIYSPVSGKVIEINELLNENPKLVNDVPYKDGWLMKILCSDLSELDNLLTYEEYNNRLG